MSGILNLLLGSAAGVIKDAYFNLVTLLLNTTSTNGAQNNTFLDSSTNNLTITRNGNTTQGTFTPFSQTGWGNFFDGSSSYLSFTSSANFAFGTGDYTVETWVYLTSSSTYQTMFGSATTDALMFNIYSMNSVVIQTAGSNIFATFSGATFATNTWYHVAVSRSSGTVKAFVNGAQYGSTITSNTTNYVQPSINTIGANSSSQYFGGYLSNLRVNKGTAVYTSAFTPSTTPLTAISGTQLLTCQSNRFLDNSTNAIALTVNGTPSVQAFSPFVPDTAYSTTLVGGSGYFDGSGDYLSIASGSSLNLGTNDYTMELWWYPIAFNSDGEIFHGTNGTFSFYNAGGGGVVYAYIGTGTGPWDILNAGVIGTATLNQWNHLAVTRSGSTFRSFLNGVSGATATSSASITSNNTFVGARAGGAGVIASCYITNCRILSGTALYTSNFTPPTAPLTAISGTTLLLNHTNAGIFDSTAKNVLETVGNAQVSTTQAKWGTTSMYFDGTGDYLSVPNTGLLEPRAGNFTWEAWVYHTTSASGTDNYFAQTNGGLAVNRVSSGKLQVDIYNVAGIMTGATTIPINQWVHIAVCRSGSSWYGFLNGVVDCTGSGSNDINGGGAAIGIGATSTGVGPFTGYMDDIRFTKGYARYTANFTPPAAAFPIQQVTNVF